MNRLVKEAISAVIAVLLSTWLLSLMGRSYNPFIDGFNIRSLLIELIVIFVLYFIIYGILNKLFADK